MNPYQKQIKFNNDEYNKYANIITSIGIVIMLVEAYPLVLLMIKQIIKSKTTQTVSPLIIMDLALLLVTAFTMILILNHFINSCETKNHPYVIKDLNTQITIVNKTIDQLQKAINDDEVQLITIKTKLQNYNLKTVQIKDYAKQRLELNQHLKNTKAKLSNMKFKQTNLNNKLEHELAAVNTIS